MCLAIFQPAGKQIDPEHLYNGWVNNPDGAGLIYFDENWKLQQYKTLKWEKFSRMYEQLWEQYGAKSPFAIHFRWATHGSKTIENVHPFRVSDSSMLIHNGVIDCHIPDKKMSDTAAFARDYLGALPELWFDSKQLFHMVEDFCVGSKLVVMTDHPDAEYCAYIVNQKNGIWHDDGIWYSNSGFQSSRQKMFFGSKAVSKYTDEDLVDDLDAMDVEVCQLCRVEAVFDDVCYECETCQRCMEDESCCECTGAYQPQLHGMTDHEYIRYESVV